VGILMRLPSRLQGGLPNTLVATSTVALAGLVSGVVLARTLGPMQRGELAIVLLWPIALGIAGDLGLSFAFSFFAGKRPEWLDGLWSLGWGASLIWGGVLAVAGAAVVGAALHLSPSLVSTLRLAMLSVPLAFATNYQGFLLLGSGRLVESNLVRVATAWFYALGVVAVAVAGRGGIGAYTAVYVVAQALACLVATALALWRLHPSLALPAGLVRPVFVYGMKSYVGSIAGQMNVRIDQLLMSAILLPFELGLYVVALAVAGMLGPFYSALAIVVLPRVTQAGDLAGGGRQVVHHLQLGMLVAVPATIVALAVVPFALPVVFGVAFVHAVPAAEILLVAGVFQGANIVLGNGLFGLGRPGLVAVAQGSTLILATCLLLLLLPRLGGVGAAIALLCSYGTAMLVQVGFVAQTTGLPGRAFWTLRWREVLPDLAAIERRWRGVA